MGICLLLLLLVCSTSTQLTFGNDVGGNSQRCKSKVTCGACIQTPGCVWCAAQTQEGVDIERCALLTNELRASNWCPGNNVFNPTSNVTVVKNEPVFGGGSNQNGQKRDPVQISPQTVRLRLRPGEKVEIPFIFSQATSYPVDLYYMMDLSYSMKDDKASLSQLGRQLAYEMKQLTQNFRLGFGSFVDKREMPFVNTRPEKLRQPCDKSNECASPYSFKNHMSLSEDTDRFENSVRDAMISANIDSPEGGLDALMQAIVCQKHIGWRPKARHMVVLSTDADYHYAGDGRLAGIVEPNDEECHMDETNEYTHGLLQDYPSVSQINKVAKKNNMNIIFAVTDGVKGIYQKLSNEIDGAQTGVLTSNSDNVVKFIRDQYVKLVDVVTITHSARTDLFDISFVAKCPNNNEEETGGATITCGGVRKDLHIDFKAFIELRGCPTDRSRSYEFEIKPQALDESIRVSVEFICDCPCEKRGNQGYEETSSSCNSKGSKQCGVCVCNEGHVGSRCECSADNVGPNVNDKTKCMTGPENKQQECSGRGSCFCGGCVCNTDKLKPGQRIWGPYCECDNYRSCSLINGKVCSGPDHGICDCTKCVCKPGWEGKNCECSTSQESCKPPPKLDPNGVWVTPKICSDHGTCECGECRCNSGYSGAYCDDCLNCLGRCEELQACVNLHAYQPNHQLEIMRRNCTEFQLHVVDNLSDKTIKAELTSYEAQAISQASAETSVSSQAQSLDVEESHIVADDDNNDDNNEVVDPNVDEGPAIQGPDGLPSKPERFCKHPDKLDCSFAFVYTYDFKNELHVFAKKEKECAKPVNILAVVLGVIGSILLAGLLLLIFWKLATTLHDRKEYEKFEEERKLANFERGDNPLYVEAQSTFQNPTFGGNRRSQVAQ